MPQKDENRDNEKLNRRSRYNLLKPGDPLGDFGVTFVGWKTEKHNYEGIAEFKCCVDGCDDTFEAKPTDVMRGAKRYCANHYPKERTFYHPGQLVGPYGIKLIENVDGGYGLFECQQGCPDCPSNHMFKTKKGCVKSGRTRTCGRYRAQNSAYGHARSFIPRNIEGQKFNHLTALEAFDEKMDSHTLWRCSCDCGRDDNVIVTYNDLTNGVTKWCLQCSHDYRMATNYQDLTGQRFGHLVAQERIFDNNGNPKWKCICDCGRTTYTTASKLKNGHTQSCGHCVGSRGEERIEAALQDLGIDYTVQESFLNIDGYPACRNPKTNHVLYFDFYLPDYNVCIEFDGQQHFQLTGKYKRVIKDFKNVVWRDSVKNQWCTDNDILLLRFTYRVFFKIDAEYVKNVLETDYGDTNVVYLVAKSDPIVDGIPDLRGLPLPEPEEGDMPVKFDRKIVHKKRKKRTKKSDYVQPKKYEIGDKLGIYGFKLLERCDRKHALFECPCKCANCPSNHIIERLIESVLDNAIPPCFRQYGQENEKPPLASPSEVKLRGTHEEWNKEVNRRNKKR